MKQKEGFTIIEILAVLIILSIIFVIVASSVGDTARKAREKTYKTKISTLETMTATYGQDKYGLILANSDVCHNHSEVDNIHSCTVQLSELIPEYIVPDEGTNKIEDPRDKSLSLQDCSMTIKIDKKTRKVTATFNESTCNK